MLVITMQIRHLIDMYLDIEGLREQKKVDMLFQGYQQFISETL